MSGRDDGNANGDFEPIITRLIAGAQHRQARGPVQCRGEAP